MIMLVTPGFRLKFIFTELRVHRLFMMDYAASRAPTRLYRLHAHALSSSGISPDILLRAIAFITYFDYARLYFSPAEMAALSPKYSSEGFHYGALPYPGQWSILHKNDTII